MAPPEPRSVVALLVTVQRGYGKDSKYFDELGVEDEEDVRRMRLRASTSRGRSSRRT